MNYIWMILKLDLISVLNKRKAATKDRIKLVLLPVLWLALAGAVYYGARRVFGSIESHLAPVPGMADAVAVQLLNGLATYVIVFVFLSGFQTTFRIIYESDDIGFLLSQPVPSRAVFATKFITAYASILPMVLVFGASTWFAWGSVNRAGLGFYVMVILSFMLLLLVVYGAVTLLLLLAMRYLPGAKLKRLFVAIAAILGMLIVLFSKMTSTKISASEDPMELLSQIEPLNLTGRWYLPTTWSVNSILGMLDRFDVSTSQYVVPLACAALVVVWLAVTVSARWYFAGWASGLEGSSAATGGVRRAARKPKSSGASRAWGHTTRMQGAFWTILRKDVKLLFRDPVLWYCLGTSTMGLGFFVYNLVRGWGGGEYSAAAQSFLSILSVMMVSIMGAVVGGQTGGVSMSREGSSFWLLQANPVDGRDLFCAKLAYAVLPGILLSVPFFVALELTRLPLYPLWRNLLIAGSISTIIGLCQILLDAYFPDFSIRIELALSKGAKGTGKFITVLLAGMGVAIALSVLLMAPSVLVTIGIYPQSSLARLNAVAHGGLAAFALFMAYLGNRVGARQAGRLLKPD